MHGKCLKALIVYKLCTLYLEVFGSTHNGFQQYVLFEQYTKLFDIIYFWQTQSCATQRSSPGYHVVHQNGE